MIKAAGRVGPALPAVIAVSGRKSAVRLHDPSRNRDHTPNPDVSSLQAPIDVDLHVDRVEVAVQVGDPGQYPLPVLLEQP
jgi:hypothetical protein